MSFNEKSAWVMLVTSTVLLVLYGAEVLPAGIQGDWPPPRKDLIWKIAGGFVLAAIISHVVLGALFHNDAAAGEDERDYTVMYKAGAIAGTVPGFAAAGALWFYLFSGDGDLMFHYVLTGLLMGSIVNYGLQVFFYRRGV